MPQLRAVIRRGEFSSELDPGHGGVGWFVAVKEARIDNDFLDLAESAVVISQAMHSFEQVVVPAAAASKSSESHVRDVGFAFAVDAPEVQFVGQCGVHFAKRILSFVHADPNNSRLFGAREAVNALQRHIETRVIFDGSFDQRKQFRQFRVANEADGVERDMQIFRFHPAVVCFAGGESIDDSCDVRSDSLRRVDANECSDVGHGRWWVAARRRLSGFEGSQSSRHGNRA